MSEIKVDTLTGKTSAGDITVTSEGGAATMQLQQGLAKAWVNFNGTGTIATRDSFNVSSLTDGGTGKYNVNYTSNMSSADYANSFVIQTVDGNDDGNIKVGGLRKGGVVPTSSSTPFQGGDWFYGTTGGFFDANQIHAMTFGDLA
jgi:hypothetical protein